MTPEPHAFSRLTARELHRPRRRAPGWLQEAALCVALGVILGAAMVAALFLMIGGGA